MANLSEILNRQAVQHLNRSTAPPVWAGPTSPEKNGGITFSLLSRFLVCRERFRLLVVEGLKTRDDFNHRLEYGNMWHLCEEHYSRTIPHPSHGTKSNAVWENHLADYCGQLCSRYPLRQQDILKWTQVCGTQFPIYLDHWATHQDAHIMTNLMREQSFDVPYTLPSGRTVRLRGKWDSVDFLPAHTDYGRSYPDGIWLQENKTKGDIDPIAIKQQLRFDLQTMIYLIALQETSVDPYIKVDSKVAWRTTGIINGRPVSSTHPILGVRYNCIRRPLSGGKGTIVQKKGSKNIPAETEDQYYTRLGQYIIDEPDHYFMRWKSEVTSTDVAKFRRECLDPILEQLCDWWDHIGTSGINQYGASICHDKSVYTHWRHPYGVWNPLNEGGASEVDEFLHTGSTVGLQCANDLFPELKEEPF